MGKQLKTKRVQIAVKKCLKFTFCDYIFNGHRRTTHHELFTHKRVRIFGGTIDFRKQFFHIDRLQ